MDRHELVVSEGQQAGVGASDREEKGQQEMRFERSFYAGHSKDLGLYPSQ